MQIKSFQIENYKCFDKTDVIELTSGINLVLGRNNVGKTALLECFTHLENNHPHKALSVGFQDHLERRSRVRLSMDIDGGLFREWLFAGYQSQLEFPSNWNEVEMNDFLMNFKSDLTYSVVFESIQGDIFLPAKECLETFWGKRQSSQNLGFNYDANQKRFLFYSPSGDLFLKHFILHTRTNVYRFKAERLNVHIGSNQANLTLNRDASNLAGALHYLYTSDEVRFANLCQYINDIFPNVYKVAVVPMVSQPQSLEIKIWPVHPSTQKSHLCIPLSECGTGIGQVLSLLFLIITSDTPRVIIIDEPNSFLHPGAVKKLIEIIKRYPQHQYIISTHSPEVIKTAEPRNVLFLTQEDGKTKIESIDINGFADQSRCLQEIGASLSDVFSADSIIWVEGITEELCFPLIAKQIENFKMGVAILSVKNTGDFQSRNKKEVQWVADVYKKLSQANALIPRAVGFVFDREGLSETDVADKKRELGDTVEFLSRVMFENYLLDVEAITATLNSLPSFSANPVEMQAVEDWIRANGLKQEYIKPLKCNVLDDVWLENVHAGKLLEDIFSEFSSSTEEYRKTRDSVSLTKWLLENKPIVFDEIKAVLEKFQRNK